MGLTDIPAKTSGDLGTGLTNTRSPLGNEFSAVNLEKIKDRIIEVFTAVGLADGSTAGSLSEALKRYGQTVDDFTDDGHSWTPYDGVIGQVGQLPSGVDVGFPSVGILGVQPPVTAGVIAAKGWGHVVGTNGPCVVTWRFTFGLDSATNLKADTYCEYGFGVKGIDFEAEPAAIEFWAFGLGASRTFALRTINASGTHDRALTLDTGSSLYCDVRLTINPTGTKCEIRLADGAWTTLLDGTDVPRAKIYVPTWEMQGVGGHPRIQLVDMVSWEGPRANNVSTSTDIEGDPWPATTSDLVTQALALTSDLTLGAGLATNGDVAVAGNLSCNTLSSATTDALAFPTPVTQSTNARTLTDADNGKTIYITNPGECTITVPQTLTPGFSCSAQNVDVAATTTWAVSGTQVLHGPGGLTKNTVRYASSGVIIRSATHAALMGALDS